MSRRVRRLARTFERADALPTARSVVRDLDRRLADCPNSVRALHRMRAHVRDLDEALARCPGFLDAYIRAYVKDPLHARGNAQALGDVLNHSRARTRDLQRMLDLARRPDDRDLVGKLAVAIDFARVDAKTLAGLADRNVTASLPGLRLSLPGRLACRLSSVAVSVLPTAHQVRYREEYRSELYEMATAGASRWRQVLYTARLLDRAWMLRAELRAPAVQAKAATVGSGIRPTPAHPRPSLRSMRTAPNASAVLGVPAFPACPSSPSTQGDAA